MLATRQDTLSREITDFPKEWAIHDCWTSTFEFKIDKRYVYQELFCPDARIDSTHYKSWRSFKNTINPNLDYLSKTLQLDSFKFSFGNILPEGGYYSYGGPGMMSVGIKGRVAKTDKEYENWQRLRNYMEKVHDTLKAYLEAKLSNSFNYENDNYLDCPFNFYLHFSKNGKLLRIATNSQLWKPDEIARYERCKKQIFAAFRGIKMPFMKPGQDFEVMLRGNGDGADIYPSTRADH